MKGHVCEQGKGNWYAVVDIKDPATGKRKRKWHSLSGCKGKREAQARRAEIIAEMRDGSYVEPSKETLAQFFDRWLKHIKPNVSPRTHERYSDLLNKNLAPLLGAKFLSKLQSIDISEAYAKAVENGRRGGKGGLSPRTVHHMHRVLFSALDQAERWKLIARNPAALLEKRDRPKIERKPVSTINAPTTAALRWKSVNLDIGQLAVVASTEQLDTGDKNKRIREKEAKSGKARTVALPSLAVEELRWRLAQAEELLKLGIRTDDSWHVVTLADGSSPQPRSVTRAINKFLKEWHIGLHGLRHSHASHMLAERIHPKVVQERLGHSSIAITMDIYSHLMPNMQGEAASAVDAAVRPALNKPADDLE